MALGIKLLVYPIKLEEVAYGRYVRIGEARVRSRIGKIIGMDGKYLILQEYIKYYMQPEKSGLTGNTYKIAREHCYLIAKQTDQVYKGK